ncbi:MAG: metallophosphoesterase [Victivallales bacterium]|nr:metallophosphoesterase [Victivallales bacterium]
MTSRGIVLIADAHVACGGTNEAEFRAMLEGIARTDFDLLFLGDIMDLWIAKDDYEDDLQRWFVVWCIREKDRRRIVYVEGNHEFFVTDKYDGVIGTVCKNRFMDDRLVAEHGHDVTLGKIGFNRRLIAFFKSRFSSLVLDAIPFGQKLVLLIKRCLGSNGRTFFSGLPDDILSAWAEKLSSSLACKDVFIGHFHNYQEFDLSNGAKFRILPAWKNSQEVLVLDYDSRNVRLCNWRSIAQVLEKT